MFDHIYPDTIEALEFGFTSDLFEGILWRQGGYIVIASIKSVLPRQGNLSQLFRNIREKGLGIKVTNPSPIMTMICQKKGFVLTHGPVEPGICDDIVDIYVKKMESKTVE